MLGVPSMEGLGRSRGAPLDLRMRNATSGGRPVFPRNVLEADHQVLWIEPDDLQTLDDSGEDLLLHFDASTDAKKYLCKNKVVCSGSASIRKSGVELKALLLQLEYAMKPIVWIYAGIDKRGMNGGEDVRLELGRLWLPDCEGDDWHDRFGR